MTALHEMACTGKVDRLEQPAINELLQQVNEDWQLLEDEQLLRREFTLKNYTETLAFVNTVAAIADQQDHHPDICFGYRNCTVTYSTHSVDGLSINDFICAAHIDKAATA